MDPFALIDKWYSRGSRARDILLRHGELVAKKALWAAENMGRPVDEDFIRQAAFVHDIGMFATSVPQIGCHGSRPYIQHGVVGRNLLEKEGYLRHALVCERHVVGGFTMAEIQTHGLPLPVRNMVPMTLEEELICFADMFFSKNGTGKREKSVSQILNDISRIAPYKVAVFKSRLKRFG